MGGFKQKVYVSIGKGLTSVGVTDTKDGNRAEAVG